MPKMTRQEANRQLVAKIAAAVEREPDMRFMQILYNYDIVKPGTDQFYEESTVTLERCNEA